METRQQRADKRWLLKALEWDYDHAIRHGDLRLMVLCGRTYHKVKETIHPHVQLENLPTTLEGKFKKKRKRKRHE